MVWVGMQKEFVDTLYGVTSRRQLFLLLIESLITVCSLVAIQRH